MRLRFPTKNKSKIAEVKSIIEPLGIEIVPIGMEISELQTADLKKLVHHKCVEAFKAVGRPLIVEHTGLWIEALNGFPGGLTDIFWAKLDKYRFAELFGSRPDNGIIAQTIVGYCDGRRVYQFTDPVRGSIPPEPRGENGFQWDPVFIPEGEIQTYAEMTTERKNEISMRRKALNEFRKFLEHQHA